MNHWKNTSFVNLHAHSKLLLIHIEENLDAEREFTLSMKILRLALNPLTDTEIKAAFKGIEQMLTFSHDRKKVSVKPLKAFKTEQGKLLEVEFKNPQLNDIEIYFLESGSTKATAKKFYNFYESKGWMVGKNKMKKWKSAAANFIEDNQSKPEEKPATVLSFN